MNTNTYLNLRTYYYAAIGVLVLYAFPVARNFMSPALDYQLISGIPVISLIAILVGVGAYQAFTTRRFG